MKRPELSIVLPSISGREDTLAIVEAAYRASTPVVVEFVKPLDWASVGEAWNAGAAVARGDVLLFAIDDAVPHAGWYEAATRVVNDGDVPSPTLFLNDGSLEGAGTMGLGGFLPFGVDGQVCRSAGIILVTRETFARVGAFLPIHYYADDDWTWRFAGEGRVRSCHAFAFTHLHHAVGRREMMARAALDRLAFLRNVAGLDPFGDEGEVIA